MPTMTQTTISPSAATSASAWSAVVCMALMCFVLVASEFMPVSLLTPISEELAISPGQVGQAISISGFFAIIASLFGNTLLARYDRRSVVMFYTVVAVASGLVVALAPNATVFMLGRALIGAAVGGFWSLSTALLARIVAPTDLPKAIAMLQGGTATATVIAAPLGSYLGEVIGWRGAFGFIVPVGLIALAWQFVVLPRLPAERSLSLASMFSLLRMPAFALGMAATVLAFMGQFSLYTYLRPFLEIVPGFDATALSLTFLAIGVAGLIGTVAIGVLVRTHLNAALIGMPLVLAIVAVSLMLLGWVPVVTVMLLVVWGFFAAPIPVGWNTWMAKIVPHQLEAGGGLQVALIQLAITGGAAVGGLFFDGLGWSGPFVFGAVLLGGSTLIAVAVIRTGSDSH